MDAVQVLTVEEDGRYVLCEDALKIAATDSNLPVAVISVAGATRGGKSFLLDFFLRYLRATEESRRDGSWLGKDEEPLTGFGWRGGCDRHTEGILMWPEPIVVNRGTGDDMQEVAVILLDTQGSFDSSSTIRDSSTVFAISTLLSSAQIYNLTQNIKEDDLQYLQLFTEYGKLARDKQESKPFQELQLLVRDWMWPYQHPHGAKGGWELLEKRLEIRPDQAEELRCVRAHIRDVFEQVSAFLLPHPGLVAASDPAFTGCLKELAPDFKAALQELVPSLLGPEQLAVKRINGQTVSLRDFAHYLTTYVDIFNSDTLPTPTSVMQATSAASVEMAVRASRAEYVASMQRSARGAPCVPRSALARHHAAALRAAEAAFNARKTFEPLQAKLRLEGLLQELEASLSDRIAINNAHILEAAASSKRVYESAMTNDKCYTPTDLLERHQAAIDAAETAFLNAFVACDITDLSAGKCDDFEHSGWSSLEDQSCIEKDWDAVRQDLKLLLPLERERNGARIQAAMCLAQDTYMNKMSEGVSEYACLRPRTLVLLHEASAAAAQTCNAQAWLDEIVPQEIQKQLTGFTEEQYIEFADTTNRNNERQKDLAVSLYRDIMTEYCHDELDRCLHPRELPAQHARAQHAAVTWFEEQRDPGPAGQPDDQHQRQLAWALLAVRKEFEASNDARNKEAVKSAHEHYITHINPGGHGLLDFLGRPDFDVFTRHEPVKRAAIQHFLSKRRPTEAIGEDPFLKELEKSIEDSYMWIVCKVFLSMAASGMGALSLLASLRR